MTEPRKIFRIEETIFRCPPPKTDGTQAATRHAEIMQALGALSTAIAAAPAAQPRKAADNAPLALQAEQLTRIGHELDAVTAASAQATQQILAVAEQIDQHANNLAAALKGRVEQGLAQDISDLVIRIFEACNFQDLAGQRITKVMSTLKVIEDRVPGTHEPGKHHPGKAEPPAARPVADTAQYLHGPRLDNDSGHISQSEIDALFGG